MKVHLISDTHWNHDNIATYCQRPSDFTELIIKNWQNMVQKDDLVIHLGDVAIGNRRQVDDILASVPGRKALVRGNHDRQHSNLWWMSHGFDLACDGMKFRRCWITHEPSSSLPDGCELNIHGHKHNCWDGFGYNRGHQDETAIKPWHRLFAIEYTDYRPVEFEHFISHPQKFKAVPPGAK